MGLNRDPGGGGPLDGCSATFSTFFIDLGSEMTRVASSAGTMYRGLRWLTLSTMVLKGVKWSWKVSFFRRSTLNGLEMTIMVLKWGTTFDLTRLYGLIARFGLIFDAFSGWSWNDTFTCLFSMEVTTFLWMVLKGVCWCVRLASLSSPWGFAVYP